MFRFIRPAKGFRIIVEDLPKAYIDAEITENPVVERLWSSLLLRMAFTALREGEEIADGVWSYIAEGAPKLSIPTIQVLFRHDMTTIWIAHALLWRPGEDDPDEDI